MKMEKRYECVVVFDPGLSDSDVEDQCKKIGAILANHNGRIERQDLWGRRKLAYKIGSKEFGIYVVIVFAAAGSSVADLRRQLRINDNVLRSLIVTKDKYAPDFDKARLVDVDEAELAEKLGDIGADPALSPGEASSF